MIRHHILSAWRSMRRARSTSFINILGLGAGIAAVLVIGLFVRDELSYDRFHENADRIFRLNRYWGDIGIAWIAHPVPETLKEQFPEVTHATRMSPSHEPFVMRLPDQPGAWHEDDVIFVDPDFFRMFSWETVAGDPVSTMEKPDQVVLTRSTAEKLFGEAAPLGRAIIMESGESFPLHVGAVVEDPPAQSHLHFDYVISRKTVDPYLGAARDNWLSNSTHGYVMLREPGDRETVNAAFPALFEERAGAYPARYVLAPLTGIHLNPIKGEAEPQGSRSTTIVFASIALLILLVGCINYVNLTTARSLTRAREVGVRKVLGADRGHLARRFLGETALVTALALLLAVAMAELTLPWVNRITGKQLSLLASGPAAVAGVLILLGTLVTLVAGSYPALYLSRIAPAFALKSDRGPGGRGRLLRQGLVFVQFAVSAAMIAATFGILRQLDYLMNKDLGFDKERILTIQLRDPQVAKRYAEFRNELSSLPGVVSVGAANTMPGFSYNDRPFLPAGMPSPPPDDVIGNVEVWGYMAVDDAYFRTLGVDFVEGRDFDPSRQEDERSVIISTTGRDLANRETDGAWADGAVGRELTWYNITRSGWETGSASTVIGVVADHHTRSLRERIWPMVFVMDLEEPEVAFVRLAPGDPEPLIRDLQQVWSRFSDQPMDHAWLSAELEAIYQSEQVTRQIFTAFAALSILLACLGLYGLAAHTVERRTKEIGVRKVLGASSSSIVSLVVRGFLATVVVANVVALPLAAWALQSWLTNYAFRADFSLLPYAAALALVLLITGVTVATQSLRAATTDPVRALRYE